MKVNCSQGFNLSDRHEIDASRSGRCHRPRLEPIAMARQASRHAVDGRGRSISTAILYEVVTAMRELAPGGEISVIADRFRRLTATSAPGAGRPGTS